MNKTLQQDFCRLNYGQRLAMRILYKDGRKQGLSRVEARVAIHTGIILHLHYNSKLYAR